MSKSEGMATTYDDEAAFSAMVRHESHRLWVVALSVLHDSGEAEDAVQDTLVKAWRRRTTLGDFSGAGPWLTRVCVNHCISRRRHLGVRGWFRQASIESAPGRDRDMSAEMLDVAHAMRRLSLRQRAAFTLNVWEGYSVDECAQLMGCRPGTVRSHLARSLATLKKELGDG